VAEKITWHRTRDPEPIRRVRPEVPEGMARVLARMMAKDPADRYQSSAAAGAALADWAAPVPPVPDLSGLRNWSPAIRRLLGHPLTEPAITPPPPPALPSILVRRPVPDPAPPARRAFPWVAGVALAAGLATAALFATRPQLPAPEASAAPPAAGAYDPEPPAQAGPTAAESAPGSTGSDR
jgi:hypothetical protein